MGWGENDAVVGVLDPNEMAQARGWGANDPVVIDQSVMDRRLLETLATTPAGGEVPYSLDDIQRAADRNPDLWREAQRSSIELTTRQQLENSSAAWRNFKTTAIGGGAGLLSPIVRPFNSDVADQFNWIADAYESAAQAKDPPGLAGTVMRGVRGAGKTVPTMIVAGRAGGAYGAIGAAGIQEANQAITEGADAGLSGGELARYAVAQGTIEAVPAIVFQKLGMGGAESVLSPHGKAVQQGLLSGLKEAGKRTLEELPEELITELSHNVARLSVDPNATSPEQVQRTIADTTVQTLITMGMVESPQLAANAIAQTYGRKSAYAAAKETRGQREAIAADMQKPETAAALVEQLTGQGADIARLVELAAKENASRKDFEELGLPPVPGNVRKAFQENLRKALEISPAENLGKSQVLEPSGTIPEGMPEISPPVQGELVGPTDRPLNEQPIYVVKDGQRMRATVISRREEDDSWTISGIKLNPEDGSGLYHFVPVPPDLASGWWSPEEAEAAVRQWAEQSQKPITTPGGRTLGLSPPGLPVQQPQPIPQPAPAPQDPGVQFVEPTSPIDALADAAAATAGNSNLLRKFLNDKVYRRRVLKRNPEIWDKMADAVLGVPFTPSSEAETNLIRELRGLRNQRKQQQAAQGKPNANDHGVRTEPVPIGAEDQKPAPADRGTAIPAGPSGETGGQAGEDQTYRLTDPGMQTGLDQFVKLASRQPNGKLLVLHPATGRMSEVPENGITPLDESTLSGSALASYEKYKAIASSRREAPEIATNPEAEQEEAKRREQRDAEIAARLANEEASGANDWLKAAEMAGPPPAAVQQLPAEGTGSGLSGSPGILESPTAAQGEQPGAARGNAAREPAREAPAGDRGSVLLGGATGEGEIPESKPGRVRGDRKRGGRKSAGAEQGALADEQGSRSDAGGVRVPDGERPAERVSKREKDFRITAATVTAEGGAVTRARNNIAAIKLLKQLEAEDRDPTPEEQALLVKHVGWGGISQAVDARYGRPMVEDLTWRRNKEWEAKWGKLYKEIRSSLSDEEFATAERSTLNAHYTSLPIVGKIWEAVQRLGFTGGTVLEPASGIGHFFGMMPQEIHDRSKKVAVELDEISARITAKLYPSAKVLTKGFQESGIPANSIDLAISNVPFSDESVAEGKEFYGQEFNLHNFFLAHMLNVVRPGGMVVAITTVNTMQANQKQRDWLVAHSELIGAIRLPNTAFKDNAGTEVTTDILFLRKPLSDLRRGGEQWRSLLDVPTEDADAPAKVNEYFVAHPEMVLGKHSMAGKMYSRQGDKKEYTVMPDTSRPLTEQITEAIANLPTGVFGRGEAVQVDFSKLGESGDMADGSLTIRDGVVAAAQSGAFIDPAKLFPKVPSDFQAQLTKYIGLRDKYAEHVALMGQRDATDEQIEQSRKELNKLYDAYRKKHGPLNGKAAKWVKIDPQYDVVSGLEYREDSGERTKDQDWKKAEVFERRTISPVVEPTNAADLPDAIKVSLAFRGTIDVDYLASLLGEAREAIETKLRQGEQAFQNPESGTWESPDRYLSGNVRMKLEAARSAVKRDKTYTPNVAALEKVQPAPQTIDSIVFRVGATWIPPDVYSQWATKAFETPVRVTYIEGADLWKVSARGSTPQMSQAGFGTPDRSADKLLEQALNLKAAKVNKQVDDGQGGTKSVYDPVASAAANAAIDKMNESFVKLVKKSDAAAKLVEDAYNEHFNGFVRWKPNGAHLTLPGASQDIQLRPYQKDAIWRFIVDGTGLLAHAVGAGKTFTLIGAAMEMRRLGIARRPMIVVQNSTLPQFAASAKKLYPGARILVADKDKMKEGDSRRRFLSGLISSDWDMVVIGHSQFESLKVDPDFEQKFINDLIQQLDDAIADDVRAGGRKHEPTQKELIKQKKKLEDRLHALADAASAITKDNISFSQLGIDALFIDEAHRYKKPPFITKLDSMVGLNKTAGATSIATMMKLREIQARNNGRGVFFATGTPVTNTLGEAWHMTNYLKPGLLREMGIETFDRFISSFVIRENIATQDAGQSWKLKTALKRFTNYREFYNMIAGAWDVVPPEQVQAEVRAEGKSFPELKDGKRQLVSLPLSPSVAKINVFLQKAYSNWQKLSGVGKKEWSGIPVVLYGIGKVAAIDARLIDPDVADDPGSKTNAVAANVASIYKQTEASKGTQLVFVDQIRPFSMRSVYEFMRGEQAIFDASDKETEEADEAEDSKQNLWLYEQIKKKLVLAGVPASEVAFIHDAKDDKQREKLYDKVNSGEIRVLIGGTQKMGVGVNVQKRLYALHHVDTPWMPSDLEQREGRILRFGNTNAQVEIVNYGMQRTLEASVFNTVARKAKAIWQAMSGAITDNEFEDPASETSVSADEAVAILSGDPLVFEKIQLDGEVRRLRLEKAGHEDGLAYSRRKKRESEEERDRLQRGIPAQEKLIDLAKAIDKGKFNGTIGRLEFTDRTEFAKAFDAEVTDADKAFHKKPPLELPSWAVATEGKVLLAFEMFDGKVAGELRVGRYTMVGEQTKTTYVTVLKISDRVVYTSEAKTGQAAVTNVLALPEKLDAGLRLMKEREAEAAKFAKEYEKALDQVFEGEADLAEKERRLEEVTKAMLAPKSKPEDQKQSDDDDPPTAEAHGFGPGGGTLLIEKQWADRLGSKIEEVQDLLPDDEEQSRRIAKAYGYKQPSFKETVQGVILELVKLGRVNKNLANNAQNAVANEFFRLMPEIPRAAMDETARTVAAIVKPLGPKQMALLSFYLVAKNLQANYQQSQANPDNPLPMRFGMDEAAVDTWLDKLQKQVDSTPEVQKAMARRKLVLDGLVERLVKAELLQPEALESTETYFHQQVLSYLALKQQATGGASSQLTKHGYRRERTRGVDELGEQFDFNTFYIEAETEWMAKAIGDLHKAELLDKLTERYDVLPEFKRLAKEANFAKLVGSENVPRILQLRRLIPRMEAGDAKTALIEERDKLDPTQPFRTRIAKAMSGLRKHIKGMVAPRDIDAIETSEYFQKVKELAEGPEDEDTTIAARSLLKAISDRNEFIKENLGPKFETWQTMLRNRPEYKLWQPRPGHYFYRALTIPAMIAEQVQKGLLDQLNISAEDLAPVMVMGQLRDPVIFPAAIVDQLEDVHTEQRSKPGPWDLRNLSKQPLRYLKLAWLYYKPANVVAYWLRNALGDIEPAIASMAPGMIGYLPRAKTELHKFYMTRRERGGREQLEASDLLKTALNNGVITASVDAQEIPHLSAIGPFRRFYTPEGDSKLRFIIDSLEKLRDFHEFFEQTRRYAAFLYYREKLAKGGVEHYGAAKKEIVDTLRKEWGDDVAAAHLARELLGDYGKITIGGQFLRDHVMPFYSWTEINLKRWPRIAINTAGWAFQKGKTPQGKAAFLAAGAMTMGSAVAALYVWNNLIIPFLLGGDPEEELSDSDRNTAHILLPYRNSDGTLPIFRSPTSSGEFLRVFGINTLSGLFPLWQEGKITTADVAKEWAQGELATATAMVRPEVKAPTELAIGASLYPDPTNPRAMPRDEILANLPGWRDEYLAAKGAVLQDGSRARPHYWPKLWGVQVTDPKENALYEIHDLRTRFLKSKGKESANPLRVSSTKTMKEAARADDFEAFREAKREYVAAGKSWETFKASIDRLDPLETQMSEANELEFTEKYLTPPQRKKLAVSREYAKDLRDRLVFWWHKAAK